MEPLIATASIGELLSWLGLFGAIPPLLIVALVRLVEGPWVETDVIADAADPSIARWIVGTTAYMYSRLAEFESEARALAARVSRELLP